MRSCDILDVCKVSHFTANYQIVFCLSHLKRTNQTPLGVEPFFSPLLLWNDAHSCGTQIGFFQCRFVFDFILKMWWVHLHPLVEITPSKPFTSIYLHSLWIRCKRRKAEGAMSCSFSEQDSQISSSLVWSKTIKGEEVKVMTRHLWMFFTLFAQRQLPSPWLRHVLYCNKDFQIIKYLNGSMKGH